MVKRQFIGTLLAIVLLSSCSDEVVERAEVQSSPIGFTTVVTKGSTVQHAADVANNGGFTVWAYQHAGGWGTWNREPASAPLAADTTALLRQTAVTSATNGSTWAYASPVDWPTDDSNVSFFAYAPHGSATVIEPTASGEPRITYTVPSAIAQQKDLLIASPVLDRNIQNNIGPVPLKFEHALSMVHFAGAVDNLSDNREIQVKCITLKNVYYKGTASLNISTSSPTIDWVVDTDKNKEAVGDDKQLTTSYTLEMGKELKNTVILAPILQEISADTCFLMPQDISNGRIIMEVTLLIDGVETSYAAPIEQPTVWLPGKSYHFVIRVDNGAIKVVEIGTDTKLDPWNSSIIIQSVLMGTNKETDSLRFAQTMKNLNAMKLLTQPKTALGLNYIYFGVYATHDIKNDITIDIKSDEGKMNIANFAENDQLIFDFKKVVDIWGKNGEVPHTVKVDYDPDDWSIVPSQQSVDGVTMATIKDPEIPKTTIQYKGSIILKRKNKVVQP